MNNALFFDDMEVVPLPPEEVRINKISVLPYPDGQRVRVNIEMTPFQIRPWLALVLKDSNGDEVTTADIIEPLNYKLELTLHIRKEDPSGQYLLVTRLYYPEQADNDNKEVAFEIRAENNSQ